MTRRTVVAAPTPQTQIPFEIFFFCSETTLLRSPYIHWKMLMVRSNMVPS